MRLTYRSLHESLYLPPAWLPGRLSHFHHILHLNTTSEDTDILKVHRLFPARFLRLWSNMLATALTFANIGILLLGSFSRFTHGEYTPEFYTYQISRAPDNESTWFIPYMDLVIASMLLLPNSRKSGLESAILITTLGTVMRIGQGQNIVPELGLVGLAVAALVAHRKGL